MFSILFNASYEPENIFKTLFCQLHAFLEEQFNYI